MSIERQILDQTRDYLEGLEKKVEQLEAGGGGGTGDAYTKAESDAKFETKTNAANTYQPKNGMSNYYTKTEVDAKIPKVKRVSFTKSDLFNFSSLEKSVTVASLSDFLTAIGKTTLSQVKITNISGTFYLGADYNDSEIKSHIKVPFGSFLPYYFNESSFPNYDNLATLFPAIREDQTANFLQLVGFSYTNSLSDLSNGGYFYDAEIIIEYEELS